MKKRFFLGLASLAIMAATVTATVASVNVNPTDFDLLSQNLEALTRVEKSDPIWNVYWMHSGDYDCSTGGVYTCSVTN